MNRQTFFAAIRPHFGKLSQSQVQGLEILLTATEGLPVEFRAYLLATAKHETAHTMQPIHERGKRAYFDKYEPGTKIGARLGNTVIGDGYKFRGRGYVQITGRGNYDKAGRKLGLNLLADPDAALSPPIAAKVLIVGCSEGWFTGKKLADYLPGDYVNARRVVNGSDRAAQIAQSAQAFEAAMRKAETVPPVRPDVEPPIVPTVPAPPKSAAGWWVRVGSRMFMAIWEAFFGRRD